FDREEDKACVAGLAAERASVRTVLLLGQKRPRNPEDDRALAVDRKTPSGLALRRCRYIRQFLDCRCIDAAGRRKALAFLESRECGPRLAAERAVDGAVVIAGPDQRFLNGHDVFGEKPALR